MLRINFWNLRDQTPTKQATLVERVACCFIKISLAAGLGQLVLQPIHNYFLVSLVV
jgi:hypothetical protein